MFCHITENWRGKPLLSHEVCAGFGNGKRRRDEHDVYGRYIRYPEQSERYHHCHLQRQLRQRNHRPGGAALVSSLVCGQVTLGPSSSGASTVTLTKNALARPTF